MRLPLARKLASPELRSTESIVSLASAIWLATVRFQISSYTARSRPSSPVSPGVRKLSPDGRIASWASWALRALVLNCRGPLLRYSLP